MTPSAVTLLASREPVSSRFETLCSALPFFGRYFRSSPCKHPFRAKAGSFVFFDFLAVASFTGRGASHIARPNGRKRFVTRPRKVQGSVKKLAMSSFPLISQEYPYDSEE